MTTPPGAGRSPTQILEGVAEALAAGDPTMWRRLLVDHLPDDRGRCTTCHISGVGSQHWPCTLRTVAERAQQLATVAVTQAASGRPRPGLAVAGSEQVGPAAMTRPSTPPPVSPSMPTTQRELPPTCGGPPDTPESLRPAPADMGQPSWPGATS